MIPQEIPLTIAYKSIRYYGYFLCAVFIFFCISMLFQGKLNPISHSELPCSNKDIYIEWGNFPTFFAQYQSSYSIPWEEFEKEILFLGTTIEPDQKILLSIKQSGARKLISSMEKTYLIYKKEKLYFSEVVTPLVLSVILQNDNLLEVNLSFNIDTSTPSILHSSYRFTKSKEEQYVLSKDDSLTNTPMFRSLENAKWWGVDYLLISHPKNDPLLHGGGKQRLEFLYDKHGEIVYIDLNEVLVWDEKGSRFTRFNKEEVQSSYAIRIKKIHDDKLEVILSDINGLPLHTFFLPLYTTCSELPSTEIVSNIKKRTHAVASFLLGQTRVTMKKGDLAIQTAYGWKITNTQEEKNSIFSHQTLGSLFAFDGMEMQGSTLYFTGRIFDPMRTRYHLIKIPILQNKRKERKTQNIL